MAPKIVELFRGVEQFSGEFGRQGPWLGPPPPQGERRLEYADGLLRWLQTRRPHLLA